MKSRNLMVAVAGVVLLARVVSAQDAESFTIKPEDVTTAKVNFLRDGQATLYCVYTKAKASEFAAAMERNLNKKLRIVINGKVVVGNVIGEKTNSDRFILLVKTADEAVAFAKYLMQELPNKPPETQR
jgi:hypothetical protein